MIVSKELLARVPRPDGTVARRASTSVSRTRPHSALTPDDGAVNFASELPQLASRQGIDLQGIMEKIRVLVARESANGAEQFLRRQEVLDMLKISKSTLHEWLKKEGRYYKKDLPRPAYVENSRIPFWVKAEVLAWMANPRAERGSSEA